MDWPMFRHVERRATRMADMIEQLDVDTTKLVRLRMGDAYAEARAKCLRCHGSRECLLWLDANSSEWRNPDVLSKFRAVREL